MWSRRRPRDVAGGVNVYHRNWCGRIGSPADNPVPPFSLLEMCQMIARNVEGCAFEATAELPEVRSTSATGEG